MYNKKLRKRNHKKRTTKEDEVKCDDENLINHDNGKETMQINQEISTSRTLK